MIWYTRLSIIPCFKGEGIWFRKDKKKISSICFGRFRWNGKYEGKSEN